MKSLATSKPYVLTILTLLYALSGVDRLSFGLFLQDIKVDLHLSDTELGLLTGLAFAVFYSTAGIPIARAADRGDRVCIIALATIAWSAAVALCGVARGFWDILCIRIVVAVGEAGCVPPAQSLISDFVTRAERPRALALYMLGGPFSVIIGYFVAGWFNEWIGWRTTFAVLAAPGLLMGILAWLTLRDVRISRPAAPGAARNIRRERAQPRLSSPQSLVQTFSVLVRLRSFRHLLMYFSVSSFFSFGIGLWQPAFFMRTHGLQTGELGTWFAIAFGLGGFAGTYLGGYWSSKFMAHNEKLQLASSAVIYTSVALLSPIIYLTTNIYIAFLVLALVAFSGALTIGPVFGSVQTLVPESMRATALAVIYLFANLIGMGLGPFAAGVVSDALRPSLGDGSLQIALLAFCPGYLWGGLHLWRASRLISSDLNDGASRIGAVSEAGYQGLKEFH